MFICFSFYIRYICSVPGLEAYQVTKVFGWSSPKSSGKLRVSWTHQRQSKSLWVLFSLITFYNSCPWYLNQAHLTYCPMSCNSLPSELPASGPPAPILPLSILRSTVRITFLMPRSVRKPLPVREALGWDGPVLRQVRPGKSAIFSDLSFFIGEKQGRGTNIFHRVLWRLNEIICWSGTLQMLPCVNSFS